MIRHGFVTAVLEAKRDFVVLHETLLPDGPRMHVLSYQNLFSSLKWAHYYTDAREMHPPAPPPRFQRHDKGETPCSPHRLVLTSRQGSTSLGRKGVLPQQPAE